MEQIEGATPDAEVPVLETPVLDTPVVEAPKSMDDTIRDTLRDLNSRGAEIPKDPTIKESPEEAAQRIRDEKGRFAKNEIIKDAPVAGAPAVSPQAPVTPAEPPEVTPEAQRLGLRKDETEAYMQAPEILQKALQRRWEEMNRGVNEAYGKAQFGETMERVLAPYQQTFQKLNVTPDKAISELMGADARLRSGDVAYLSFLADNYGFDRAHLAQVFGGQVQVENPINPQVVALEQEVRRLSGMFQDQQNSGQQREQEALNSAITTFAADPKHSHFPSVKGHMSALLQAGHAKDLDDAYEQAIYANPTTRALVIAEQQTKARAEAAQKAQAAKDAASVNVRKRPSLPPSTPIGSMDDTIRATLRTINAR